MWKVYNVIEMVRRTTFICSSTCRKAEHVEQRGIIVFPNPATNYLNVVCKNAKQIEIMDLLGNVVFKSTLNKSKEVNRIEINKLTTSVYLYKVIKQDNSKYYGKILID